MRAPKRPTRIWLHTTVFNPLTPNDLYMSRTAPLTFKHCILYIYSTNVGTEYVKHALYSPFFFSSKCSLFHNANFFRSCIIHILYTVCAEIKKKNNSGAKGLITHDAHSTSDIWTTYCILYHLLPSFVQPKSKRFTKLTYVTSRCLHRQVSELLRLQKRWYHAAVRCKFG